MGQVVIFQRSTRVAAKCGSFSNSGRGLSSLQIFFRDRFSCALTFVKITQPVIGSGTLDGSLTLGIASVDVLGGQGSFSLGDIFR